jgi:hypothetical protein
MLSMIGVRLVVHVNGSKSRLIMLLHLWTLKFMKVTMLSLFSLKFTVFVTTFPARCWKMMRSTNKGKKESLTVWITLSGRVRDGQSVIQLKRFRIDCFLDYQSRRSGHFIFYFFIWTRHSHTRCTKSGRKDVT